MRFTLLLCCLPFASVLFAKQPNVVVILTDDQGYGDLSCHGNPVLETPHLDRLHAESIRLTDFHVAPMCTPTRGQLLTGLDAAKTGAINVSSGRTMLRAELPTMADIFASNGYATGIFGKWHLGDNYPFRPEDRGFEETLWFPSSHINSTPDVWDNDYFDDTFRRNGTLTEYKGYCTDVFFDEAIAWMKRKVESDQPFFTYLPTNAPHWPYWLPQKYRDAMATRFAEAEEAGVVPELPPGKRRSVIDFLAMIRNIDDNVGKLENFLHEAGITDDTILVFLTDNGSTLGEIYFPAGMKGRKTQLWEGGHRVPCFVRWPNGEFGEPRDISSLSEVQDLLPTLLELTNAESDLAFDGISLAPALRDEDTILDDRILVINYSRMPQGFEFAAPDSPSLMRRDGAGVLWQHWRLLENRELYHLADDPLQQENVIAQYPEVAAKLRKELDRWWNEVSSSVNKPEATIIGHDAENPMMLTACEWLDVFIDQQRQVRRADLKNGWWELEVAQAGEYEFELRRWPRDADLALNEAAPETEIADGILPEGLALPITRARIKIGDAPIRTKPASEGAQSVTFTATLKAGRTRLYTWFDDADRQPIVGAYYVYVTRK